MGLCSIDLCFGASCFGASWLDILPIDVAGVLELAEVLELAGMWLLSVSSWMGWLSHAAVRGMGLTYRTETEGATSGARLLHRSTALLLTALHGDTKAIMQAVLAQVRTACIIALVSQYSTATMGGLRNFAGKHFSSLPD